MRYLIVLALLALTCGAFADSDTAPVNLAVDQYVFAAWAGNAGNVSGWNHALYNANPLNDVKVSFNLEVDGAGSVDSDTVNVAWTCNCDANVSFSWNPGNLPGVWTMKFDGPLCPPVSPPGGSYNTENADENAQIIAPVMLSVSGVNYTVRSGAYTGWLTFTTIPL